jgi:hypothetical protein
MWCLIKVKKEKEKEKEIYLYKCSLTINQVYKKRKIFFINLKIIFN